MYFLNVLFYVCTQQGDIRQTDADQTNNNTDRQTKKQMVSWLANYKILDWQMLGG